MDKIPLDKFTEGENGSYAWLDKNTNKPLIVISKGEYGLAEKYNQLIDWNRELQDRIFKLENK